MYVCTALYAAVEMSYFIDFALLLLVCLLEWYLSVAREYVAVFW